ncbi:hypothetical protein BC830DRAFT_1168943 [Chytriomyces sp. MP71]|nr:hypothetical protein BC830DRAFT_1168943 [Chytriomyces sp. MP71]
MGISGAKRTRRARGEASNTQTQTCLFIHNLPYKRCPSDSDLLQPTEEAFPVSESDVVAQSTLETKANHGEHLPDRENFLPLEIVSPITPTSSSPPPPPPPPAPLLPIPSVIVTRSTYFTEPEVSRNDTREGNELVDTESFVPDDDGRDGKAKEELEPNLRIHRLLNEIRFFKSKQVLRQTATVPHPAITGTGNPRHDITEILKRRAALEMSDDSSLMSESDDAEWS